jgi:hypothetical protein
MPSRFRGSDGRYQSEADADFAGPLRLCVAGGLAYALWLAFKASSPFPSEQFPAAATPLGPSPSPKGS